MRNSTWLGFASLTLVACGSAEGIDDSALPVTPEGPSFAPYADDGRTVAWVDPARYIGLWYEIATTGSFQQGGCAGTTARYTPLDEVTLEVYNRCLRGGLDGPVSEITGTATTTDATFSRLLVDFGFGFAAPYDIVERDDATGEAPYAFAAVSSFDGAQLWILAREPSMEADLYESLVSRLEARGYEDPRGRLTPTEHASGE